MVIIVTKSDGTPLLDGGGNHLRKKVGLTPLTIATGTMFDKRQILMQRPTNTTSSAQSLDIIAEQLAAYAKNVRSKKAIEGEVMHNES